MGYHSYPKDFAVSSATLEKQTAPLVSIVVPVYNTPVKKLERCMATIVNQTYSRIEVIIVDDGSNQPCAACIDSIAAKDERIRVIKGGHKGVSNARNLGMKEANGEWLVFSDADDENEPTLVEEALSIALSKQCDLVCGSVVPLYVGEKKFPQPSSFSCYVVDSREREDESRALALQMLGPVKYESFTGPDFRGRGPVAKLYKASLLEALEFDCSISIGEDTLFNYRYLERCTVVAIAERPWYWYYQHAGSAVHSTSLDPWVSSIEGILANCKESDDRIPFVSRCAFMSIQGITSFAMNDGVWEGRSNAVALLEYANKLGCFGPDTFSGFVESVWEKAMYRFCANGWYSFAYFYWMAKRFVRGRSRKQKLTNE